MKKTTELLQRISSGGLLVLISILLLSCGSSEPLSQSGSDGPIVDELRLVYDEDNTVSKQVGATVSNDGKHVAFSYKNGTVKVIDLTIGRTTKTLHANLTDLFDIRFNYDATKLVLASNNERVEVLDIKSGDLVTSFTLPEKLNRVAVSKTDDYVAFGIKGGTVDIYDLTSNKKIQQLRPGKHHVSGLDFDPNGKKIAVSVMSALRKKNPIRIYDVESGREVRKIKKGIYSGLSYTEDGNRLIVMGMKGLAASTIVNYYDFNRRTFTKAYKNLNWISLALFTSAEIHNHYLLGGTIDQTFDVIDINTGEKVYTTKRGKTKLARMFGKMGIDKKRIYALYDGKSYLINYSDNNINQIYNAEAHSISAYLYSDANDDFAVVARDGRMEGSAEAIANVAWSQRKSNKHVPLEATFDQFYTPNLLQSLLSADTEKQDIASLEKAIELSPLVEITRPDSVFNTDEDQLKLTVKGTPQGDPIKEFKVFVNGKPLGGDQRGLKMSGNTRTFTVPLLPGRSIVSAVAVSEGGYQSAPARIIANYEGQATEANLHVLAVGIDKYYNQSYNLNYATADAFAFTEEIKQKAGGIFGDINITYIKNKNATKDKIRQAVDGIQSRARLQDVFIFYYAGHGVMSEGTAAVPSDFYLALHDVTQLYGQDQMLKEKGISAAELRDIFSGIQAQKQLIVLDACQSGGAVETFAMRGAAEEKAMIQLARSSGVVLLASTGTEQFATEFDELGHGVFTYSILQGLSGQADSGDNKVTVKELEAHLNDSVPELTEKYKGTVQFPRSWSRGMDFPIGVINE